MADTRTVSTTTGPVPKHLLRGQPTSVNRLAAMAGVARRTMARRLLLLTPAEAVALGPVRNPEARRVAAQKMPRRRYVLEGERRTIAELAALAGCNEDTMRSRLDRGAAPEDAVAAGARRRSGCAPQFDWLGQPITGAELARLAGCRPNTMYCRLRTMTPAEAVAMGAAGGPQPRRAA